jgi:intracellular septation protein
MKLLVDFLPIIVFFVIYKLYGIYPATVSAIAASLAQVAWLRWRTGRFEKMPLITLGLIALFGGLTLALRDPIFVMWKPTLVNWLFALAFVGGSLIGGRPVVERMLGHAVSVPMVVWWRLNWAWVLFFVVSGLANLFVVYIGSGFFDAKQALVAATGAREIDLANCAAGFSGAVLALCERAHAAESIWVDFKLFGLLGMTAVFVIAQAFYLARHIAEAKPHDTGTPDPFPEETR